MKTTLRFVALGATVLLAGLPLRAQAPSSFEPIVEGLQGPPLWISAEAVADEEKIINLDLIDHFAIREEVERQRRELGDRISAETSRAGRKPAVAAIPASECKSSSPFMDDPEEGGRRGGLAGLAAESKSIVRGTVRTVDPGFASGIPSSLIGVEVSEVIKGSSPESPFYIDYPVARFKIGPYSFCNENEGFEPSPGDEILFFVGPGPVDRDRVLYIPSFDQLFFQSRSGSLFLPLFLKNAPDFKALHSLDEVVDRLHSDPPLPSYRSSNHSSDAVAPANQPEQIEQPEQVEQEKPSTTALLAGISLRSQPPSILMSKVEGPPLWISAEAVADEEKVVNLDPLGYFGLALKKIVEKQRRDLGDRISEEKSKAGGKPAIVLIPASECKYSSFIMDDRGGGGGRGTLADLATYSRSIVRGMVRTVDPGFFSGSPSSLVGVEVSAVLKGPSPESLFYVDYSVVRFRIGPYHFCNTMKGFEPSPGDEVLLFDYTGPVDRDQVLYAPRLDQIFFQSQSGSLFVPFPLNSSSDLRPLHSLDEVVDRLEAMLALKGSAQ